VAIGKVTELTEQDRARISQAVQQAERGTRAEIVPMIVERSGLYRDAQYRAGLMLALIVLAALVSFEAAWLPWGWHRDNAAWLLLATLAAYALGHWSGTLGPVIRAITPTERMKQKVRLRAERAFARHGIARTRERTGVLIMLSMFEHQVYVLPDREVGSRITSAQWQEAVQVAVEQLRQGDLVGGLCAAIERCGTFLTTACPARPGDNPNEISDRVIQEP